MGMLSLLVGEDLCENYPDHQKISLCAITCVHSECANYSYFLSVHHQISQPLLPGPLEPCEDLIAAPCLRTYFKEL